MKFPDTDLETYNLKTEWGKYFQNELIHKYDVLY
jgi:hypothetical protein